MSRNCIPAPTLVIFRTRHVNMPRGASKNSNALFEIVVLPMDRRSTIARHRSSCDCALGVNFSPIGTDGSESGCTTRAHCASLSKKFNNRMNSTAEIRLGP
jgi:hypothetical protein